MWRFLEDLLCTLGIHDLRGCVCQRCGETVHRFTLTTTTREEHPGGWHSDFGPYDYVEKVYWKCNRCGELKYKGKRYV